MIQSEPEYLKEHGVKIWVCIILSLLMICFGLTPSLEAANPKRLKTQEAQLKNVNQTIVSLKERLSTSQSEQKTLETTLKKVEQSVGVHAKKVAQTKRKLKKQQEKLSQIQKTFHRYEMQLQDQKTLLYRQIEMEYQLGRVPFLKIILNQENPEEISRFLMYYQYINQARLAIIQDILNTSQLVAKTLKELKQETLELEKIHTQETHQTQALKNEQHQRQALLKQTKQTIRSQKQRLQKLYQNKKRLESVIRSLKTQAASGMDFYKLHKKLPWPVKGRVIENYHQTIADSQLKTSGIVIAAHEGTQIKAIYDGKVVFANWLKGFGQLVIIQHGKHYMTLYGRAQSLYVKEGQNVEKGQVIATVGNSGGFDKNALYFEIRHNAQPVNPFIWLKRI